MDREVTLRLKDRFGNATGAGQSLTLSLGEEQLAGPAPSVQLPEPGEDNLLCAGGQRRAQTRTQSEHASMSSQFTSSNQGTTLNTHNAEKSAHNPKT